MILRVGDNGTGKFPTYIKDGEIKIIDVILPRIIEIQGVKYSVTEIASGAFKNERYEIAHSSVYIESEFESFKIPNSVTSIGDNAFYNCSSLTSIEIPDSVTNIGSYAFYGCSSLTSIEIPASVTSIGSYAFYGCSNLTDVYYTGSEEDWAKLTIWSENTPLTSATIHYNYTPESQS